ncbi:hypothetical protein A3862_30080 (plasmid) [Methylobacterium sp. XJLW]|nr:hypothetical protein A3862_04495 [Methylobacterium sp. XJLW]AWV19884.1 hypothetical protein A3862_30080 [Methylobacterium sp. XJLW]
MAGPLGQAAADGGVDLQRAPRDVLAGAADHDGAVASRCGAARQFRPAAMPGRDQDLPTPLDDGVRRHQTACVEDLDLVGELVDLDDTPCPVGHTVEVAADAHEAFVGDAPLQTQHGPERYDRQRLQTGSLFGEGFRDDAQRGAVQAHVGDGGEPIAKLDVQVLEIAEATGEEEVLAHVAERPLHLSFGLRPVGPAGARQEAIVGGQCHERAVVDDVAILALAGHRGLHAVVEDLQRHAAQGREGGDVAAQDRLQILVQNEARPDVAGVAQHH